MMGVVSVTFFGWVWVAARFLTTRLLKLQNEKLKKGIFAGDSLFFIRAAPYVHISRLLNV